MRLLDLIHQVKAILAKRNGGTGNPYGWGSAVVEPYRNASGATIPLGTIVRKRNPTSGTYGICEADPTEDSTDVLGVVVGYYADGDGSTYVEGDAADNAQAAVMTMGRCQVLVASGAGVGSGHFAFVGPDGDGTAKGDATVGEGAFGRFETIGDASGLVWVHVFGASVFGAGGGSSPLTTKGDLYGYDTADARVPVGTNGQVLTADSSDAQGVVWASPRHAVIVEFQAPTGGQQADFRWPWDGTVVRWTLAGDATGSAVVDVWKRSYAANTFPTVANTITAAAKPTLSSGSLADSTTLTGWTTTFSRGDMVRVNVDSVSGIARLTLVLEVTG